MTDPLPTNRFAVFRPPIGAPGLAVIVALSVMISLTAFSPRLSQMIEPVPGSFQWTRGTTYLQQCEQPFRTDIEPAMHWRLLPPLVAHALGLPGNAPFILPWLGALSAVAYVAVLFRRRINDWRWVAGGTLLFTSSSAALVPFHWLGLNDAWVWLGLLAVSFGRTKWALPVSCLLCPWIDERFVIGFPLAWLCGVLSENRSWSPRDLLAGLWLLPYLGTRLIITLHTPADTANTLQFMEHATHMLEPMIPWVPLAWWMGLRGAWVPLIFALSAIPVNRRLITTATLVLTLGATVFLAADLSRSIAIVSPLILLGCFIYAARHPATAPGGILKLALFNLLIPAAHVVYNKFDLISPLPVELIRLFHSRG